MVLRVDYYDRKSELLKTAIFTNYKKIKGIWRNGDMTMTNHQNGKKTILSWSNDKIDVGLKKSDFSKRKLKR